MNGQKPLLAFGACLNQEWRFPAGIVCNTRTLETAVRDSYNQSLRCKELSFRTYYILITVTLTFFTEEEEEEEEEDEEEEEEEEEESIFVLDQVFLLLSCGI